MKKCFTRAQAREAVHKETKPYRKSNLTRATSARSVLGSLFGLKENTSTRKTTLLCGRNKKLFNFYLKNRI